MDFNQRTIEPFRVKTDVVWWKHPVSWFACAVYLAAIIASYFLPDPFSEPLAAYRFTDTISVACAIFGPLYIIWGISFMYRCFDAKVRKTLGAAAFVCSFWMLVTALKLVVTETPLLHVIQYVQYVFLITVFVLIFRAAFLCYSHHRQFKWKIMFTAIWSISIVLSIFIVTNDVHGFVFSLGEQVGEEVPSLSVGIVGWIAFAWCFTLCLGFLLILCFNHNKWNKGTVIVLFPCIILWFAWVSLNTTTVYSAAFILTPIISPLFCMLLVEVCLQTGLIPGFWSFGQLFKKLPFNTILLGHDKQVLYVAENYVPLDENLKWMFQNINLAPGESTEISLSEKTAYRLEGIHGGNLVVVEDRSALAERAEQLREKQQRLKDANRVLKGEHNLRLTLARRNKEDELFVDVKSTLDEVADSIRVYLNEMPTGNSPEEVEERRKTLSLLKILVAYCKRKGALVIAGKEDEAFTQARLQLVINETASDMRSIGIECGALVDLHESLPVASVAVLYDCFYAFAFVGLNVSNPVLMAYINDLNNQFVQLKCILEFDEKLVDKSITSVFEGILFPKDVIYGLEEDDGAFTLSVAVSRSVEGE